ncbi:hypothetical protein [Pseudoroseicyclus sp. CXY001]|uniref:hypothetical protein n=1 Tax=Pseudoroseicyclus sp. CXY001 TaxID=3242492 RepID=UPI00358DD5D3
MTHSLTTILAATALALAAGTAGAQEACYYDPANGRITDEAGAGGDAGKISPVAEDGGYASFFIRGAGGMTIVVHDCASGAALSIDAGSSGRGGLIWEFEALMEGAGAMSLADIAAGIGADVETTLSTDDIGNCDCLSLGLG